MRQNFDYVLAQTGGPKFPWPRSEDFFSATLEVMRYVPEFCLLPFVKSDVHFLNGLFNAMVRAEVDKRWAVLESRPFAEFADLMGQGKDEGYWEGYLPVPGVPQVEEEYNEGFDGVGLGKFVEVNGEEEQDDHESAGGEGTVDLDTSA